jgi:uncharacterized protein (TIGR02246 family)
VDKEKKNPRHSGTPADAQPEELDDLYRRLTAGARGSRSGLDQSGPDPMAAALEAAQRLAAEGDVEQAADDVAQDLALSSVSGAVAGVCRVCGHRNREGNRFCSMCGAAAGQVGSGADSGFGLSEPRRPRAIALHPNPFLDPEPEPEPESYPAPMMRPEAVRGPTGQETHHYHHHYHHHYFPGGEGMGPRGAAEPGREGDRMRPSAALRGDMSRAEAAVRRITQEWVLACNTKHLDDLLELYVPDALVLRSNCPPIRGAAAVREFFFGALDAGLGEVEVEPLRVEVLGDMAYEAGRCKALVPSATGKRREERGKYLWVCARQNNGEWKLAADCWASDLTLTALESDVPLGPAPKTRKGS